MRALPFLVLLLLAAALAGSILWQLRAAWQPEAGHPAAPPLARNDTASPPPPPAPADRAPALAETSLRRPLFSPDRRPPAPGATAAAAPDLALPRLTGILVSPDGRSAIFAGGPPPVVVREGGRIGSFLVRAIEPGQVTLLGPDGPRLLRPSFGAARPATQASTLPSPDQLRQAPAPSPTLPDAPKDAMPFEQNPTPSGMDILRNQAARAARERAPAR